MVRTGLVLLGTSVLFASCAVDRQIGPSPSGSPQEGIKRPVELEEHGSGGPGPQWTAGPVTLNRWGGTPVDVERIRAAMPRATLVAGNGMNLYRVALPEMTIEHALGGNGIKKALSLPEGTVPFPILGPHGSLHSDWALLAVRFLPIGGPGTPRTEESEERWEGNHVLRWNPRSGELEDLFSLNDDLFDPNASPDGSKVAFRCGGEPFFRLADIGDQGVSFRKLPYDHDRAVGHAEWLPDGESFLFTTCAESGHQICRYDIATGKTTPHTPKGMVTVLPSGRTIVVNNGSWLHVFSYPELVLQKAVHLVHSAESDAQVVALDEDTLAYLHPGPLVVVVGIGEVAYQAPVAHGWGYAPQLAAISPRGAEQE